MLQEGKTFSGIGFQKGWYPFKIMEEIHNQGGGLGKYFTK
jgi:hypothetical protein